MALSLLKTHDMSPFDGTGVVDTVANTITIGTAGSQGYTTSIAIPLDTTDFNFKATVERTLDNNEQSRVGVFDSVTSGTLIDVSFGIDGKFRISNKNGAVDTVAYVGTIGEYSVEITTVGSTASYEITSGVTVISGSIPLIDLYASVKTGFSADGVGATFSAIEFIGDTTLGNPIYDDSEGYIYLVKVYVGGDTDIESIGLSGGVCRWSNDESTVKVLTENWTAPISDSVDIPASGNYAKYSTATVNIVKSKLVESLLNNYGLTLTGSRVEILEYVGGVELMLRRGVILDPVTIGNTVSLPISHVANYYNAQMSPSVGSTNSPLVFGDSVEHVKLNGVKSEPLGDTTIGDDLTPSFRVLSQDKYVVKFVSVYPNTVIVGADIEAFQTENEYVKASHEKSLILKPQGNVIIVTNESGVFYGFTATIVPLNIRDENGDNYLPTDSTVILEGTAYDKIYTPYGSPFEPDNLEVEQAGSFSPFPSYIDSRVDYPDEGRIEILDADNSGDSFVAPQGNAKLNDTTTGVLVKVSRGVYTFGAVTIGGVAYENEDALAGSYLSSEGDPALQGGLSSKTTKITMTDVVGTGEIWLIFDYPLKTGKTIPAKLYPTMINYGTEYLNTTGTPTWQRELFLVTIASNYSVASDSGSLPAPSYEIDGELVSAVQDYNILPQSTNDELINTTYRWSNVTGELGRDRDAYELVANDYEKETDVRLNWYVKYSFTGANGTLTHNVKMAAAIPVEYDTDQIYLSSVDGREDINGNSITDTASAYLSTLQLQNYQTLGIAVPTTTPASLTSGWGLQYPDESLVDAINSGISVPVIPLSYVANKVGTNNVKLDIIKYTNGIGYIDNNGLENWASVLNMYVDGGYIFDKHKIKGMPTVKDINPTRVYPDIGVTYANGTVSVENTEQEIYSSTYVSGVDDPNDRTAMWFAGNLLYKKYKIKAKFPTKLGDISGIKNKSDAVQYVKNQYAIAGVTIVDTTATLYKRYTLTFTTSREYIREAITTDGKFELGSSIRFSYPNIATGDTGVVTGIIVNPLNGETTVTAECVGESIDTNEENLIIEDGAQTDTIVESGTRTDNYVEEI